MWDLAFPRICLGCDRLLREDAIPHLCTRCRPQQARLPDALAQRGSVRASWSYEGPLSRAVVALKFEARLAFAGPLAELLAAEARLRTLSDGSAVELLVPVPLHWRRRVMRGFDQAQLLASWTLRHARRREPRAHLPRLACGLLRRVRATTPQTSLLAAAREANLRGAFEVPDGAAVRGRRLLVLDDVTTTGATAHACIESLLRAGAARVEALALLRRL